MASSPHSSSARRPKSIYNLINGQAVSSLEQTSETKKNCEFRHTITCCVRDSINGQKMQYEKKWEKEVQRQMNTRALKLMHSHNQQRSSSICVHTMFVRSQRPYREKCVRENVYSGGRYHISFVKSRTNKTNANPNDMAIGPQRHRHRRPVTTDATEEKGIR